MEIKQSPVVPLLVNTAEAARLLAVCPKTLRRDRTGRFPAPIRLSSRCLRWSVTSLRDWVEDSALNAERTRKKMGQTLLSSTVRV
jgi:predicted DNA-binding transcriptional regulator AlpA